MIRRLKSLGFEKGKPTATREIRGKFVIFRIEDRQGNKRERIRPRTEFGVGDYLDR